MTALAFVTVMQRQVRRALADRTVLAEVRRRDGDQCRYCGTVVDWRNRYADNAGTYDCRPGQQVTADTLVVACRTCDRARAAAADADERHPLRPAPAAPVYSDATRAFLASVPPQRHFTVNGRAAGVNVFGCVDHGDGSSVVDQDVQRAASGEAKHDPRVETCRWQAGFRHVDGVVLGEHDRSTVEVVLQLRDVVQPQRNELANLPAFVLRVQVVARPAVHHSDTHSSPSLGSGVEAPSVGAGVPERREALRHPNQASEATP